MKRYMEAHCKRVKTRRRISAAGFTLRKVGVGRVGLVLVLTIAWLLPGCATGNAKMTYSSPPKTPDRALVPTPPGEKEQETLAAVEDFLERTRQYRLSQSATPLETHPTDASTAKAEAMALTEHAATMHQPDQAFANTQVALPEILPPKPTLAIPAVQSVSVHSPEPTPGIATEPGHLNATNTPLDVQPPDDSASVDRLLTQLRNQVDANRDFDAEWQLRLVELAFDRDAQAMDVSSHLGDRPRALMTALMPTAVAVRDAARDPLHNGEEAIERVEQLRETVADQADPVVSTVAMCRKVITFGAYELMPSEDFVAGRSTQTIVYSEIANLRAEQTAAGLFQTRLGTRLEVLTADGKSVWQREEPEIVDTCRRRRGDFFIAQRITLPPTLPVGEYVLKVFVEDKLSAKANESSIPFTISSPVSVAKGRS